MKSKTNTKQKRNAVLKVMWSGMIKYLEI